MRVFFWDYSGLREIWDNKSFLSTHLNTGDAQKTNHNLELVWLLKFFELPKVENREIIALITPINVEICLVKGEIPSFSPSKACLCENAPCIIFRFKLPEIGNIFTLVQEIEREFLVFFKK